MVSQGWRWYIFSQKSYNSAVEKEDPKRSLTLVPRECPSRGAQVRRMGEQSERDSRLGLGQTGSSWKPWMRMGFLGTLLKGKVRVGGSFGAWGMGFKEEEKPAMGG